MNLPATVESDPAALALLDAKLINMGIPDHIRNMPYDPDAFVIQAKHEIDMAKELATLAGYRLASVFGITANPNAFAEIIDRNGMNRDDATFAAACAQKFGNLTMTPGDAPPKARQITARSSAAMPTIQEQQSFGFFTGEVDSTQDFREVIKRNRKLNSDLEAARLAKTNLEGKLSDALEDKIKMEERIAKAFDEQGNPRWTPANEDEVALLTVAENLRNGVIVFVGRMKRLRCNSISRITGSSIAASGISPDIRSLIEGTIGFIENMVNAETVAIRASMGIGDPSSEQLLQNAADDLQDTTIRSAENAIAKRNNIEYNAEIPRPTTHIRGKLNDGVLKRRSQPESIGVENEPRLAPTTPGGVAVEMPVSR